MKKHILTTLLALAATLSACEYETYAEGYVLDFNTGAPIQGAQVIEIAVLNKTQEVKCEGYTDSTGHFEIDCGLVGLGPRKVEWILVVQKDSFRTITVPRENYDNLIRLEPQ